MVREEWGVMSALERGWRTARDHLGPVVVMTLILGIGGGLASLLIALPVILVALPAGLGIVFGELAGSPGFLATGLVTAGVCLAVYLPVLILVQGILLAYIQAAWTLTYRRLRGQNPAAASCPQVSDLGVCLAVYLPVLILVQGILLAYIQAAWTLTYRRLRGQNPAAASGPEVAPTPTG